MRVTRVNISTQLIQKEGGRLLAYGSMDFDNELRIEKIRVVKTLDGRILICMPSLLNNAGVRQDIVHPISKNLRQTINDVFIEELKRYRNEEIIPIQ